MQQTQYGQSLTTIFKTTILKLFWGVYIMFPFQTRVSIVVLALTYVTTIKLDDVTRFGNCVQLLIGNELLVNGSKQKDHLLCITTVCFGKC